jgi:hypothetical protein
MTRTEWLLLRITILSDRLTKLVLESYPYTAKALVTPLVELLRLSRDTFGGDIDRGLVFYVIAVRTIEHHKFKTLSTEDLESGALHDPPSLHTNARSIAESLGIPRESVRRRVQQLISSGLVVRHSSGLIATSKGMAELAPVRRFLVNLAVRYFHTVRSVISEAEQLVALSGSDGAPRQAGAPGLAAPFTPSERPADEAHADNPAARNLGEPRSYDPPAST